MAREIKHIRLTGDETMITLIVADHNPNGTVHHIWVDDDGKVRSECAGPAGPLRDLSKPVSLSGPQHILSDEEAAGAPIFSVAG